jgi:hypothetical protein
VGGCRGCRLGFAFVMQSMQDCAASALPDVAVAGCLLQQRSEIAGAGVVFVFAHVNVY